MLRRVLAAACLVITALLAFAGRAAATIDGEAHNLRAGAEADLIAIVNSYRAANGLQAVSPNGALTGAASWMAGDMAAKSYIAHVSSDGRSPTQRMSAFGYPATSMFTGEDLGAGYGAASAVLSAWQASAAHNAVLLNPNYNAIGVGVVYNPSSTYKWYWAADFGGPGGTVKVVLPPTTPPAPAQPRAQPAPAAVTRAAPAARGAENAVPEDTVDPEVEALAERQARLEEIAARRVAHLIAVLVRIGAL